jgi:hypothetical protein
MGQQVGLQHFTMWGSHPKPSDLIVSRLTDVSPEDLTHARRKALG